MAGFIQTVMPYAQIAADIIGVDPAWIVAQWHLETGGVIDPDNNLGGIKSYSGSKYGVSGGTYMTYPNLEYFARDYADFLKPYAEDGVVGAKTPQAFFGGLKAGGYAEDSAYVDKALSRLNYLFPNYKVGGYNDAGAGSGGSGGGGSYGGRTDEVIKPAASNKIVKYVVLGVVVLFGLYASTQIFSFNKEG